jgi:hypothetical protein
MLPSCPVDGFLRRGAGRQVHDYEASGPGHPPLQPRLIATDIASYPLPDRMGEDRAGVVLGCVRSTPKEESRGLQERSPATCSRS